MSEPGKLNERVLVIVPTYNEAQNIVPLLEKILQTIAVDVLVVDDNSPDGTGRLVENLRLSSPRLHLLKRPGKAGLAAAYTAGFQWGLSQGYDILIEMDADFSHPPAALPALIGALADADAAIGCRYIEGGDVAGWSATRKVISRGGNFYAQKVLGLPYQDLTGGFNAWRAPVLHKILNPSVRSRGYAFQVELKHRAHHAGFRLVEVPFHFENRVRGVSKMSGKIVWEAALRVLEMRQLSPN